MLVVLGPLLLRLCLRGCPITSQALVAEHAVPAQVCAAVRMRACWQGVARATVAPCIGCVRRMPRWVPASPTLVPNSLSEMTHDSRLASSPHSGSTALPKQQ